ncbi:MAG: hypothetical protein ACKV0T_14920 [Planctomycetales bacterium]
MSCLKLYWPQVLSLYRPTDGLAAEEATSGLPLDEESPVILSFPRRISRVAGGRQSDLLTRARLIHANRDCPICGRAAVVPVDAEPVLMSRDKMPVPGAGRLVGFECDACGHAWGLESATAKHASA